jgi:drug/metabolite transporter (DMT)-like permease
MPLLSYQPRDPTSPVKGRLWFVLALVVFLAWGIQAYVLRFANASMRSESIFLYMTLTGLLLVPVALYMTDFGKPINWGPSGPWLAAPIQLLNSIGALTMVYAFRHGKVIIVSPMINALAPVITILLSLALYRVVPHRVVVAGMALAALAFYLMA